MNVGRRPISASLLVLAAGAVAALISSSSAHAQDASSGDIERGRELFLESCQSCHAAEGQGTRFGPSLDNVGAASVDFYLRTGRMPLADPDAQAVRKPPAFSPGEIDDLVAYVTSLSEGGPGIPDVDPDAGELSTGEELFTSNCAPCHGANGNGGAVGGAALAPSLLETEPLDVGEAVLIGPGQMPVFGFSDAQRNSIVRYVNYLQEKPDPGGADIGGIGPVPEGFVAWGVGIVSVLAVSVFIGSARRPEAHDRR